MRHRIVTFNVNGLRARADAVLDVWERLRPTVLCLQETKCGRDQVPEAVLDLPDSVQYWHPGPPGYAGTAMLLRASALTAEPLFEVLPFDTEGRGIIAHIDRRRTIVTLYMPNGGKDYAAKIDFYGGLVAFAERAREAGRELWICGDMNVAHTDRDIHPRDLPKADIGVRPDERACFERLLETGLVDVFRRRHPEADDLFTWWPYWRGMREQNRGWRIDYHLGSPGFGEVGELLVHREPTGSDHAPVLAEVSADG